MVTMLATVLAIQQGRLLVFDFATRQQVLVHTRSAGRFRPGNLVRIFYNGVMTKSIPPQISALRISLVSCPFPWQNACQ